MRKIYKYILFILTFIINTQNLYAKQYEYPDCDLIIQTKCTNCNTPFAFVVGFEENCIKTCPNRITNNYGTGTLMRRINCALEECPPNLPYRDDDGSCYKSKKHIPNYQNNYIGFYDMYASDNNIFEQGVPENNKGCPQTHPLLETNECFSCYAGQGLLISEKECKKCPNRKYIYSEQLKKGKCILSCPQNKPLQRWDGKCYSCDETKVVNLETWCNYDINCDVCPNRTILYNIDGIIPSIPNCPKEKPLMDTHGICYSCNSEEYVDVKGNEYLCEKFCPNKRFVYNGICILNGQKYENSRRK